jgi:hypothetical protein
LDADWKRWDGLAMTGIRRTRFGCGILESEHAQKGTSKVSVAVEGIMGRGAQQQTQQLTDQQLAQQNQYLSQEQAADASDRSLLIPAITSLLNSQGYTPGQQSAITQEGMGAARTAYDALRESAANRVAATNNSAGYGALVGQLGRDEADQLAQQGRQNQIDFANAQYQRNLAGLQALGQTYGIDTNLFGRAMGIPGQLLGVRASVSNGSSLSGLGGLGGLIGSTAGSIGSLFG